MTTPRFGRLLSGFLCAWLLQAALPVSAAFRGANPRIARPRVLGAAASVGSVQKAAAAEPAKPPRGPGAEAFLARFGQALARPQEAELPDLLQRAYDSSSGAYYSPEEEALPRLEEAFESKVRNGASFERTVKINQANQFKDIGEDYEVRFPQDEHLTRIYTYGFPYGERGKQFVDFAIWGRSDFKESALHDRDAKVLRRMPYDDFQKLVLPGFQKYRIAPGKTFILPAKAAGGKRGSAVFGLYRVERVLRGDGKVELAARSGERRAAAPEELLFWNAFAPAHDVKMAEDFFAAGGRGDVFRYEGQGAFRNAGYYLRIDTLPERLRPGEPYLPWGDEEVLGEARRLQGLGVPLLLTNQYKGYYASVKPAGNRLMRFLRNRVDSQMTGVPGLVITPTTNIYTLHHELVHWVDCLEGRLKPLLASLKKIRSQGRRFLTGDEASDVYHFLGEQRAYASELEFLQKDAGVKRSQKDNVFGRIEEAPFAEYAAELERRILRVASEHYGQPVRKALDRLSTESTETYRRIKELIRQYSYPSEPLSPERVFPGHFKS